MIILRLSRSILECPFYLRNGERVKLEILLPGLYPEHPPRLVLDRDINHPLVDAARTIRLPILNDWRPEIKLVDVVNEAKQKVFMTGGPTPVIRPPPSHSSQGSNSPVELTNTEQRKDLILQLLSQMSNDQLLQYLTAGDDFMALVSIVMPELKILDKLEQVKEQNKRLAEANLERESELQERKNQLAIVKSSDFESTLSLYNKEVEEHRRLSNLVDIPRMIQQLDDEARTRDKESEDLLKSALEGNQPADVFVKEYMKLRKEHHLKDLLAKSAARLR